MDKLKSWLTLRTLVFVLGAIIIVYLLPRTTQHTYIYEMNRPWNYSLLTAPFDIPVQLDSASVRQARDSVDRRFIPIYKQMPAVTEKVLSDFSSELNRVSGVSADRRRRITENLRQIYSAGVVDESSYNDIVTGRLPQVRTVRGNELSTRSTSQLRSPMRAYERIRELCSDEESHSAMEQAHLASILTPNTVLDTVVNSRMLNEQYQKATAPVGVIQQGERIIDRGDIVTTQLFTILHTYEQMLDEKGAGRVSSGTYAWLAKFLYVGLLFGCMAGFLYFFRRWLWRDIKAVIFLVSMVVMFSIFAFIMSGTFISGLYIVPFTMVPIMGLVFFDGRTALFTHIITVLITATVATFALEFVFMQFVGGVVAINSLKELSRRTQLLRTGVLVFVGYVLAYIAVNVMQSGTAAGLTWRIVGFCGINVVFVSFAYVLISVFEHLFGFTSMVGLVELSDINHPVLRELSKECPGTFQHSMAVSNLATEAAIKIGANVQLVRAGAMYHDIGKIDNPAFFTENQHGVNPHDALTSEQSARIIIGHVTGGLRRAEKAGLPSVIRDFIAEHHGRGMVRYFYVTACRQNPDDAVDATPYTYPGPNPRTRETSILMMADAVEAASRSLKDYSAEAIEELVNRIIDTQVKEGLHNDSTLEFRDVRDIKQSFIQRLRTIYHSRIAYPK